MDGELCLFRPVFLQFLRFRLVEVSLIVLFFAIGVPYSYVREEGVFNRVSRRKALKIFPFPNSNFLQSLSQIGLSTSDGMRR